MAIVVIIEGSPPRVDPGGEASISVRIRNAGDIVDEFFVTAVGDPERWTTVEPASVSLFPGVEESVQLRFQPPRSSDVAAGRMPFGVMARSRVDAADTVVEWSTIDVLAFHESTVELAPRAARAWRGAEYSLRIANSGNEAFTATITAGDPDLRLDIAAAPASVEIDPGRNRAVNISVRPNEAPLFGSGERLPFIVSVGTGGNRAPLVTDGAFERRPPLGRTPWPLVAVGAVVVIGVLLLLGVIRIPNGNGTKVTDAPGSPTPDITASPSPTGATPSPDRPVTCGSVFTTDTFFNIRSDDPTEESDRRACLIRFVMSTQGFGEGPVALKVEGVEFFRFDMAEFDSIGEPGAGSGERQVELDPQVPVKPGEVIELDVSGCSGEACDALSVSINASNAP